MHWVRVNNLKIMSNALSPVVHDKPVTHLMRRNLIGVRVTHLSCSLVYGANCGSN